MRETQRCSRDPRSQRAFVSSLIGSWESGGPPPLVHLLSWHFSELPLALHSSFYTYCVCLRNLWNTLTNFASALSLWPLDNQLLTVWNPSRAQGWWFVLLDFKQQFGNFLIYQNHLYVFVLEYRQPTMLVNARETINGKIHSCRKRYSLLVNQWFDVLVQFCLTLCEVAKGISNTSLLWSAGLVTGVNTFAILRI